ncbi:phage minor head protein [Pseudanabaena sp. 'Roaring Creek']|uniref:phage head morphogenesis protein n=1 Tax=Pseudanabaena sp. 'Roaring Creek' TaxID=1681830 RepID=UPI0006D7EE73|nr:phage minor head protein [Pseudanabaena sp. 'Roaring Creek']
MIPDYLKLPPLLAIDLLKSRISLPIDFKGLDARLHDYAFMVSGLMRADLLETTKKLLLRSLENGESASDFAENLQKAIMNSGWSLTGTHVKTIFTMNINKINWDGRKSQMTSPAMRKARPIWIWRWRDSPIAPRLEHQKLNNKGIPADHPFWESISFPCGYGCRCSAFCATEDYCKRNGIEILTTPPDIRLIVDPPFRRKSDNKTREQILKPGLARLSPDLRSQVARELKVKI